MRSFLFSLALASVALFVAAPSVFAYTEEPAWVTNSYFAASVTAGEGRYINGDWSLNAPATNETSFAIDSTQTVYHVAKDGTSATRRIIRVDCDVDYADYYYLGDITNDVVGALAALSLVTNEDAVSSATWLVLKNGNEWVSASATGVATDLADYRLRLELDYTTPAAPLVRYQVSADDGSNWYTLTGDGAVDGWFSTAAAAPVMSNVCFVGKATLASLDAKLSTTAAAEVNGKDFAEADILDAVDEAKASGQTIVLYQDVMLDPADLRGTRAGATYTFEENGQTLTVNASAWKSSDKTGVETSYTKPTLTVGAEKALVARIGEGDDEVAYLKLDDALAAGDGKTVVVLTNVSENASLSGAKAVALDLAGFTLTTNDAAQAILAVSGANAKLFLFGGTVTGATDVAAISAADGAVVTIDELIATNNAKVLAVAGGSTVVISNGLFTGAFEADDDVNSQIRILGGYLLAKDGVPVSFTSGKVTASGGKFTETSKTAATDGILASGYKFASFAVPFETNGFAIAYEIMTNVQESSTTVETKVWNVEQDGDAKTIGGVQLADSFITDTIQGGDASWKTDPEKAKEAQANLNVKVTYGTKGGTIRKWERAVLGMDMSTATEGPCVKGVQNPTTGKIGFKILSPEVIKAKESGCDVKFSVEAYSDASLTTPAGEATDKVDYDQTAELAAPSSGVRYYKLKMYIESKK